MYEFFRPIHHRREEQKLDPNTPGWETPDRVYSLINQGTYWVDHSGEKLLIGEMETGHLSNVRLWAQGRLGSTIVKILREYSYITRGLTRKELMDIATSLLSAAARPANTRVVRAIEAELRRRREGGTHRCPSCGYILDAE